MNLSRPRTRVSGITKSNSAIILTASLSLLAVCLTNQACHRPRPNNAKATEPEQATSSEEVNAAWYDVPVDSLAQRRAGTEELTAAHNQLPLGTRLRVTHLTKGKSVVVRVTDRGITDRKIQLDLCKQAARELDMIGEGVARVRIEVLSDKQTSNSSDK